MSPEFVQESDAWVSAALSTIVLKLVTLSNNNKNRSTFQKRKLTKLKVIIAMTFTKLDSFF